MSDRPPIEVDEGSPAARVRGLVEAFAHDLVVGLMDSELHGHGSPAHRSHLQSVARSLREAVIAGAELPVTLEFVGGRIRWEGHELVSASLQAGRMMRLVEERDIASFGFQLRTEASSLVALLELLGDPLAKDAFRPQTLEMVLRARGIRGIGITLGRPAPADGAATPSPIAPQGALAGYQALAGALQDSHVRAFRGNEIELDHTRGIVERAVATMGTAPSDLLALAVYDDIDRFTVGHSVRVALLALQVARAASASEEQLMLVGTAGLLHDIGKSHVPQEVLFKQGKLDSDEWAAMAEHPRLGAAILLEQKDVHPAAIGAAFCHHMTPGCRGYPGPLAEFDPSGISKLVRVCDVFEALTAVRPYKGDLTPLEALAIMHREAAGFDPHWFRFFVQVIGIYPVGTRVRLDSDEKALVVRQGVSIDRPIVRIIADGNLDDLPAADATELAIGDSIDGVVRRIDAVVRKRNSAQDEDPTRRALQPIQHACLGKPNPPDA